MYVQLFHVLTQFMYMSAHCTIPELHVHILMHLTVHACIQAEHTITHCSALMHDHMRNVFLHSPPEVGIAGGRSVGSEENGSLEGL